MTNKSISQLSAGSAVSSTDLIPDVQTVGVGPVKVTAAQIGNYVLTGSGMNGAMTLGTAGTTAGTVGLSGGTSGVVTVQTAAAAGTWSLTLPTSGGTNNYVLTTNGSGVSSWSQVSLTAGVTGTLPVGKGGTGTATSFTTGSVPFAGASGVYSENNSKFFWDNTNFRLGIGTPSPTVALDIVGVVKSTLGYGIGSDNCIIRSGNYNIFYDGGGRATFYLGGPGDPTNYYDNATHNFRTVAGAATIMTLNAAGASLNGASLFVTSAGASSIYIRNIAGTNRIDSYNDPITATYPLAINGSAITFSIADAPKAILNASGNFGLGTTTFGTSATSTLALFTGTAPSTGPADTVQIYSSDLSAGNTMLSVYTEGTCVNANATAAATNRIAVRINGTVYYLLANTSA